MCKRERIIEVGTVLFRSDVAVRVIPLDSLNAMTGGVRITHTGSANVAIDNGTTALNLGPVSAGQNFEARSGGGITDSGVITVAGTSLFHSDFTGRGITLDSVNAMTGALSITHTVSATVAIDNGTKALNFGIVSADRHFKARSGGGATGCGGI